MGNGKVGQAKQPARPDLFLGEDIVHQCYALPAQDRLHDQPAIGIDRPPRDFRHGDACHLEPAEPHVAGLLMQQRMTEHVFRAVDRRPSLEQRRCRDRHHPDIGEMPALRPRPGGHAGAVADGDLGLSASELDQA